MGDHVSGDGEQEGTDVSPRGVGLGAFSSQQSSVRVLPEWSGGRRRALWQPRLSLDRTCPGSGVLLAVHP